MSSNRRDLGAQTPPGGGELDHDAMRAAAMRPMAGPDHMPQAAGGGLELPGREPHEPHVATSSPVHEPIPGERDRETLTWREPGSIGGRSSGADTPSPARGSLMDARTARDHELEGGGTDHD